MDPITMPLGEYPPRTILTNGMNAGKAGDPVALKGGELNGKE